MIIATTISLYESSSMSVCVCSKGCSYVLNRKTDMVLLYSEASYTLKEITHKINTPLPEIFFQSKTKIKKVVLSDWPYGVMNLLFRQSYLKSLMEDLGPLHKRCPVCNMVMLKKNLSRHVRDQHSQEKPRWANQAKRTGILRDKAMFFCHKGVWNCEETAVASAENHFARISIPCLCSLIQLLLLYIKVFG